MQKDDCVPQEEGRKTTSGGDGWNPIGHSTGDGYGPEPYPPIPEDDKYYDKSDMNCSE